MAETPLDALRRLVAEYDSPKPFDSAAEIGDLLAEFVAQARLLIQVPDQVPHTVPDSRGNRVAVEGCDRCFCGCKYWENDRCIDCGTHIDDVKKGVS